MQDLSIFTEKKQTEIYKRIFENGLNKSIFREFKRSDNERIFSENSIRSFQNKILLNVYEIQRKF